MVREIGLALPEVEEGTMYGSPALKVHRKLLTCLAIHKSAEPQSLAVRIDFDQRARLLADEPKTSPNKSLRKLSRRAREIVPDPDRPIARPPGLSVALRHSPKEPDSIAPLRQGICQNGHATLWEATPSSEDTLPNEEA